MLEEFFTPVDIVKSKLFQNSGNSNLGGKMRIFVDEFPDLEDIEIAIIGVKEGRETPLNEACAEAPDEVRSHLYQLKQHGATYIADLGNIEAGQSFEYTLDYLSRVINILFDKKIVPLIIGGSKQLAYALYRAFEGSKANLEIVAVDSGISLYENSYLNRIMLHDPNYLFNFTALAYQSYFVEPGSIDALERMYFDHVRLGALRNSMEETEPVLRNSDILVFDIGAIKQADAPGNYNSSPNGLLGDEACQIARYAGMSSKLSSFGLFEINPQLDSNGQTAKLAAQIIWYFIEGFYSRKDEDPSHGGDNYIIYRINLRNSEHELVFHKSKLSDRWWMELPYRKKEGEKTFFIPCSYKDYLTASNDEMPDRWWRTLQKLV